MVQRMLRVAVMTPLLCAALPAFAQQDPVPRGNPESWLQTPDYPAAPGSITVRLTADPGGAVRTCKVTETSGSGALDAELCAKLRRRARFVPAPAPGEWTHRYSWPKAG